MNSTTESACYDYEKIMQGLDQIENVWKAIWKVKHHMILNTPNLVSNNVYNNKSSRMCANAPSHCEENVS